MEKRLLLAAALLVVCACAVDDRRSRRVREDDGRHPVLLVPGVAGSVVQAETLATGKSRRVWLNTVRAETIASKALTSFWDDTTNTSVNLDYATETLFVSDDDCGLTAIRDLDPSVPLGAYKYFDAFIRHLQADGFVECFSLWGFPYDWRQRNDHVQLTQSRLRDTIEHMYILNRNRTVDVVSHSMGGLVMSAFLALYPYESATYLRSWTAVACPFQGGTGVASSNFITGYNLGDPLLSEEGGHQLSMRFASTYCLLPNEQFDWTSPPVVSTCVGGQSEVWFPSNVSSLFLLVNQYNTLLWDDQVLPYDYSALIHDSQAIFRREIVGALPEHRPPGLQFYNVHGTGVKTIHSCFYRACAASYSDLLFQKFTPTYADGDGTVELESAVSSGLAAQGMYTIAGVDHVGLIKSPQFFVIYDGILAQMGA